MPQKVRDLVCKASRLGKSTLPITESKELSSFVPLYLLCRTFDLYDRTKQLDIDFKTYRNEFELLQAELNQVTELIDKVLMPLWELLDSATLHVITSRQIRNLRRFHATLRQLAQVIHEDLKKAHNSTKCRIDLYWKCSWQHGMCCRCCQWHQWCLPDDHHPQVNNTS